MQIIKPVAVAAILAAVTACSPAAEVPEKAPPPVVPAAYVGSWSSGDCTRPYVRIGVSDIRHSNADQAVALTSATASPDGTLVLAYVDQDGAVTETWKLTDGKLDLVTTVWPDRTDKWASDPMSLCPGPSPLDN